MFDGVLQSFLGLVGTIGIPFCMEELQFYSVPKSSLVYAELIFPEHLDGSPLTGVVLSGDAVLYLSRSFFTKI